MKNPVLEAQWRVGEPTEIDEPVFRIAYSTGEFAEMMGVPISRVRHWIAALRVDRSDRKFLETNIR